MGSRAASYAMWMDSYAATLCNGCQATCRLLLRLIFSQSVQAGQQLPLSYTSLQWTPGSAVCTPEKTLVTTAVQNPRRRRTLAADAITPKPPIHQPTHGTLRPLPYDTALAAEHVLLAIYRKGTDTPLVAKVTCQGSDRWADRLSMGPLPVACHWAMKPRKASCGEKWNRKGRISQCITQADK